ncbi:MAG: AbrB/MazE/SpoVT family DNA-binding domain-containing protein [Candidatus Limnocylindria bacterium]
MVKKLTRTGNSVAVVLDKAILDAAGLAEGATVEVSTDGEVIVIAPVTTQGDADRLRLAEDWAHHTYEGAFKRLAK